MSFRTTVQLTHGAVLEILTACVQHAEHIQCPPVNIAVASRFGQIIASITMDDAYFLSAETARNKALTAASHKIDTRYLPDEIKNQLALASGGKITAMAGGLPIWIDGECVGGIGVGGASDEDDIDIAEYGVLIIGGSITKEQSLQRSDLVRG